MYDTLTNLLKYMLENIVWHVCNVSVYISPISNTWILGLDEKSMWW